MHLYISIVLRRAGSV